MSKYAFDTNILIDALNQSAALEALQRFLAWALPQTYLSAVVLHELAAGATTARQRALVAQELVGPFERRGRVFAPSPQAWVHAGELRSKGGKDAGLADLLLAQSCRERGITLITRDRQLRRLRTVVRGLRVVDPFPAQPAPGGA